ncbi:unnamed protein product [Larinioides sclopetarius]|uniref:Sushi, von Willebrand factor type A, EGF and pentraxin domain-containing protein 1 n=1 Tax=Larinioides sclopetarius TaxID=280406 RepID=A0AAV2BCW4_9ARAC
MGTIYEIHQTRILRAPRIKEGEISNSWNMINKRRNLMLVNGKILIFVFVLINSCIANDKEENAIVAYLSKKNFSLGKAEIVFLLDRSGSVGAANFETEKGFVESFLTHIVVDANASRVAVISYSDTAERHIDYLREPKTKCSLSQELIDVVFENSRATNIAAALEEARLVFENARPNVNKVLILVSDGLHTMGGDPVPHADRLKASGVEIFCFGIGRSLRGQLENLASSKEHVYNCDRFRDFERLAKRIRGDPHESSWSGQAAQPNCDHLCDSPYRGEPIDPGCCDHSARCSCALLSGMHLCVCGPGYYGYSGLAGQCRACPKGTYKSRLEPANQCKACPAGSTTTKEASTSLKDCVCKEGYEGDPLTGLPCTLRKCPPLQKPTNGFVFGDCEDSEKAFGSECHFLCEEGFELVDKGNDLRTCLANGSWSGKNAVCRRIHCTKPPQPSFGLVSCDKGDLLVGSKCRFSCFPGFIMEGSAERECLSSQRWSGTEAKCTAIQCELPPPLMYGQVIGCKTSEKPKFGETCAFACSEGFKLEGPNFLFCMENGKLLDNQKRPGKPICKDVKAPVITCPPPLVVSADRGSKGTKVDWKIPRPSDNSGLEPKLFIYPEFIFPPVYLELGRTTIQYVAVDHAGHKSSCSFQITVYDDEPPTVVSCPSKIEVTSNDVREAVFWDEPQFGDNSGRPVSIVQTHRSGDMFTPGRHTVTYEAIDYNNNKNTCVFDVFMNRNTCPYYPAPTNGALSCNDWLFGQICQTFCNDKNDFVETPADWYVCNEKSVWVTIPENMPIPWPDCSKKAIPGKIRHMMKGFYYHGDCNDPQVQIYIKKVFLHRLSMRFEKAELCISKGTCNLKTVTVHCGKITGHLGNNRRRRNVWEHAEKEELELEFEITIDVDQELNDTDAVLQNFLETIQNLKWDMDEDFSVEATTLAPDFQADSDQWSENLNRSGAVMFTEEETTMECKPGSVLSNDLCVLCSAGTFYEASARECWDCPLGHYQQIEGQMECHKCPEGMTTEYARSRNITECKGVCLPGTYSPTGLETCLACPTGTYQEREGQKACNLCPEGTTTASSQSVSILDCRDLCVAGSFSNSRLQPCEACPKGFYQPLSGQTSCLECPGNFSTFMRGSTNVSDCSDLDPCGEDYCKNFGICTRLGRNAVCLCAEGFTGLQCEVDIDECVQKPCFNDGACINTVGSFYCNCSGGFRGALCDQEVDECLSFPCMNNGTCIDKVNDYACICPAGHEGARCERAQEICYPDILCLNGGRCVEGSNHSFCACPDGFEGIDCSVDVDDCENATCLNNGRCVDEVAAFKCVCPEGYMGPLCEIDIDECQNQQCWIGSTCQDRVGGYVCLCPPGWSGRYCETSDWTLYKDGKLQSNGTNLRPRDVIPGGGSLVIGQEQDAVGEGFSPKETFTGNITRVNVWNSYFSKSNITRLCSLDDDIPGKVVAWPDFLQGVEGRVNILQNERPT